MSSFSLSPALQRLSPSQTMVFTQLARDLTAQGKDVISLSVGEPDFDTPAHIAEAGIAAIRAGKTRYTAADGIPALKAAVRAKFARDNSLDVDEADIVVTPGGKYLIYAGLIATLHEGDEVIVPSPYWVSYPEMAGLAGGTPVIASTQAEDGFRLTPAALEAAITPRTRWLILNTVGNPTGAVYSRAHLEGLAEVLRRHPRVMILTDDLYEHLVYEEAFVTLTNVAPDLSDRTLIVNGVSKAYAMTGWRVGFGAGPSALMTAIRKFLGQTISNTCSIAQHAAVEALTGDQTFLEEWRGAFRDRRELMVSALAAIDGVDCAMPGGAFYTFPSIAPLLGGRFADDNAFALALLKEEGVAVVPGAAFGQPGHVRLSYATSSENIREAMARFARFCGTVR